jgi:predicted nucleotidyltransferase component of viral defense system
MQEAYYLNRLYPFQDEILSRINTLDVEFYLSGGTALSRCFLMHRYSDDLDLFLNDHPDFKHQSETIINFLNEKLFNYTISITSDSFLRIFINKNDLILKIDFINDIPFHFGNFERFDFFEKVDNWRNILSNKLCALSRMEPKDYADILFIAQKYSFNWEDVIQEAKKKDLWVEPIKISKMIREFPVNLLNPIKWITRPEFKTAASCFSIISEDILKGFNNSIVPDN